MKTSGDGPLYTKKVRGQYASNRWLTADYKERRRQIEAYMSDDGPEGEAVDGYEITECYQKCVFREPCDQRFPLRCELPDAACNIPQRPTRPDTWLKKTHDEITSDDMLYEYLSIFIRDSKKGDDDT
jgi:hypothetical protein